MKSCLAIRLKNHLVGKLGSFKKTIASFYCPAKQSLLGVNSPLQALGGQIRGCDRWAVGVVGLGVKIGGELFLACGVVEKSKPAQVQFKESEAGESLGRGATRRYVRSLRAGLCVPDPRHQ